MSTPESSRATPRASARRWAMSGEEPGAGPARAPYVAPVPDSSDANREPNEFRREQESVGDEASPRWSPQASRTVSAVRSANLVDRPSSVTASLMGLDRNDIGLLEPSWLLRPE